MTAAFVRKNPPGGTLAARLATVSAVCQQINAEIPNHLNRQAVKRGRLISCVRLIFYYCAVADEGGTSAPVRVPSLIAVPSYDWRASRLHHRLLLLMS